MQRLWHYIFCRLPPSCGYHVFRRDVTAKRGQGRGEVGRGGGVKGERAGTEEEPSVAHYSRGITILEKLPVRARAMRQEGEGFASDNDGVIFMKQLPHFMTEV